MQDLVGNAAHMKSMKDLTLMLGDKDAGLVIAHAGSLGGWPKLEYLTMSNVNGVRYLPTYLPVDAL